MQIANLLVNTDCLKVQLEITFLDRAALAAGHLNG